VDPPPLPTVKERYTRVEEGLVDPLLHGFYGGVPFPLDSPSIM